MKKHLKKNKYKFLIILRLRKEIIKKLLNLNKLLKNKIFLTLGVKYHLSKTIQ